MSQCRTKGPRGTRHGVLVWLRWSFLVCLAAAASRDHAVGQTRTADEYELKATLVLNFGRYSHFSDETIGRDRGLVIGVASNRRVFTTFEKVMKSDSVKIKNREVTLVRLEVPEDLDRCDIAYITEPFHKRAPWKDRIRETRVMVLGEDDELLEDGGDAILKISPDSRMVFDVRQASSSRKAFIFRSQLLSRARNVMVDKQGGQP